MLGRMLPRLGSSKLVSVWIWVTLLASIVAIVDGGWIAGWAALAPARIWRGEVWRLVTWGGVERGPLQLVVTCASIYKFGGELAPRWGGRGAREPAGCGGSRSRSSAVRPWSRRCSRSSATTSGTCDDSAAGRSAMC